MIRVSHGILSTLHPLLSIILNTLSRIIVIIVIIVIVVYACAIYSRRLDAQFILIRMNVFYDAVESPRFDEFILPFDDFEIPCHISYA